MGTPIAHGDSSPAHLSLSLLGWANVTLCIQSKRGQPVLLVRMPSQYWGV